VLESRITNTVTVPDFCVMSDEFNVYKICTEVLLNDRHFKACLQKVTVSFVMSVCLSSVHMDLRLPQDGIL